MQVNVFGPKTTVFRLSYIKAQVPYLLIRKSAEGVISDIPHPDCRVYIPGQDFMALIEGHWYSWDDARDYLAEILGDRRSASKYLLALECHRCIID